MVDFQSARKAMVDHQVATSGVTDPRLLSALRRIPREIFIPADRRTLAYTDAHHPLGRNRFVMAPATLARLLQLAEVLQTHSVLDCWPGTGYSTAILASLAREIVALEPDAALAEAARANLAALGITNATVLNDDRPSRDINKFDTILIEGALENLPESLLELLVPQGRLICLVRKGPVGTATVLEKGREGVVMRTTFNANLPVLDAGKSTEDFVF
jgi:protein-L-isoaspartate(D-aspartate) O-methyltransferase